MEKRTLMVYIIIILLIATSSVILAKSEEDVTTVQDSAFQYKMRPKVFFLHEDHNEKAEIDDCSVCHHLYEEGILVEDEVSEGMECSECHELEKGQNPIALVNVYHGQCKGCHRENKAGPIQCSECHIK